MYPSLEVRAGLDFYVRKFAGDSNRWGDYSGACVDPSDESFWVFNQYALDRGTILPDYPTQDGRWGTVYANALCDDIIPVELTSFTAVIVDENVQLNWTTATEVNNQGFEIQRSKAENEYEKIGYVPGHGTTTEIQTYSYTDSKVASGNYTYRLKQIDYDGTIDYSDEVAVEVTAPLEFALEQNYPNPFNPGTLIKYSIPENGFVTLDVYNLLGEKVASLVNSVQEAGRYEINFDASELASGIYVYSLRSGSFNSVKKMLLMK